FRTGSRTGSCSSKLAGGSPHMAIITMIFRKIAKNRWIVGGLFVGIVLCTALASSIPLYKDAIKQRMMLTELEHFYEETGIYPGNLSALVRLQNEHLEE